MVHDVSVSTVTVYGQNEFYSNCDEHTVRGEIEDCCKHSTEQNDVERIEICDEANSFKMLISCSYATSQGITL